MADYSIYMLGESDMTIVGGVLDGVTQGNGSHLIGTTITLNDPNWTEIAITDDDANFQDTDGSQVLNGAQVIDGVLYADGTVVEAEYSLTLTDGTNTYEVVAFNVNESSPSYGTVEGLAFIGPQGGFPPIGVELTVVSAQEGPSFAATEYATPICFARGVLIATAEGLRSVEALRPGDLVLTRDRGYQPLRWCHTHSYAAHGAATPVLLRAGSVGNDRDLLLSPQHKLLVNGWRAELLFGQDEVLVAAKDLVNGRSVVERPGGAVTYTHLLFDQHELILGQRNLL